MSIIIIKKNFDKLPYSHSKGDLDLETKAGHQPTSALQCDSDNCDGRSVDSHSQKSQLTSS